MTDIYYPENSTVKVYTFVEKEVAAETPDGLIDTFTFDNTIANTTGLDATPLPDYKDAVGNYAIRDAAIYYRKNGFDTQVDEADISSITGTTVVFAAPVAAATADAIIASYSYTEEDLTFEVTDYGRSGGERNVEQIITYGGYSIDQEKPQTQITFDLTSIKKGLSLSEAVNGKKITTTTEVTGKTITTVTGGSTRLPRTIVITATDPLVTTNKLLFIHRNVKGVSNEISAGAEDYFEETVSFSVKPTEYGEVTITNT